MIAFDRYLIRVVVGLAFMYVQVMFYDTEATSLQRYEWIGMKMMLTKP